MLPLEVPLLLDSPIAHVAPQPVTRGVPFPRGALQDPQTLGLFDHAGAPIPLQTEPLARWPDGSVKWLLLDFLVPAGTPQSCAWLLRVDENTQRELPGPMAVAQTFDGLSIDTGAWIAHLDSDSFLGISRIVSCGEDLLRPDHGELTDWLGMESVEPSSVSRRGTVRTTVSFQRWEESRTRLRIRVNSCFFQGLGLARYRVTFHNPWPAIHRGGLWDLGSLDRRPWLDPRPHLALASNRPAQVLWQTQPGSPPHHTVSGTVRVLQQSSGGENWRSPNHVDADGKVVSSRRGYVVEIDHVCTDEGLRARPTMGIQDERTCILVAVPEFSQQFPLAIEASVPDRKLLIDFHPQSKRELQGGEQKSYTLWFHFGPPDAGVETLAWVHQPLHVHLPPEWYSRCGAVPPLAPGFDDPGTRLQQQMQEVVEGPHSFFAKREVIDEYGWRNYGEVYADHENAHADAPTPVVSHYNNQYDVVYGLLLHYWRTGDRRWWELADPLARHVIDIDIYHTKEDRAAYSGGMFWHTDHYKDAATCTHRAYSRANKKPGQAYGGGPSNEHNYTTGLLHYHYLTGDPEARDAVLSLADWVVRMDDGRLTLLGLVDEGPTGLASQTREPGYHGPGRGAGNSINALLDGWLLTQERHYLEHAEKLIRRCIHPRDDIASRNLLDIENRWSYTVLLVVLSRYLDLKAEAGELDENYAYARASLVHYGTWMAEHEKPYFDHPEKLEYPTETWAAQELRKANVLRLVARHVEEPLRSRFRARGEELAERAWSDLLRFESRFTTRPQALVLIEGLRDAMLRGTLAESAPEGPTVPDFGAPEEFVPQKQRVKALLKSPAGLAQMALRLLNPAVWLRWRRRGKAWRRS
jgi:hypothetical protein